jgi:hypothetical protein
MASDGVFELAGREVRTSPPGDAHLVSAKNQALIGVICEEGPR